MLKNIAFSAISKNPKIVNLEEMKQKIKELEKDKEKNSKDELIIFLNKSRNSFD